MDKTRVLKTAAATLRHVFEVDETPTDSTTQVTVAVTGPTGATVAAGNATAGAVGSGSYSFALAGQPQLTSLTVAWSATIAGAPVVETDVCEIVGGFFFTLREGRASDSSLQDTTKYPTDALKKTRVKVEEECEKICARAFVARYRRVVLDGNVTTDVVLPDPDIRTIRSVTVSQRAGLPFVALTTAELAALVVTKDGQLRRSDGVYWPEGNNNVIIEYEYGLDSPPEELKDAAMIRLRSRLNVNKTQVPDRASSFTAQDGGTYRLDMPGAYKTGIPFVDAVYSRYSLRSGAGTGATGRPIPSSRTLQFDPQFTSLMHGGRR